MTAAHVAPSPLAGLSDETAAIAARARAAMAGAGPLGVAYSGGVDTAVVLALAVGELGSAQVVGILGISPSVAGQERVAANVVAAMTGARVVGGATKEQDNAAYRANDVERCFFCKDQLFSRSPEEVVTENGLASVAYGENADDAKRPDRPGSRAATNHQVLRPLAE